MHTHETFTSDPGLLVLTGMWLAMMTAMMAPVAAPWVIAFSRFRSGGAVWDARSVVSTLSFTAGYLTAWLGYSIVAAALQRMLVLVGVLDPQHAWSSVVAAAILIGAGAYQFSPIKRACLTHCRNPITYFLTRWRNGSDHRLIVAGFVGRQDTDIMEAGMHRQCGDIARRDGPVVSDKVPGVPAIRRLHRYE